MNINFKNAMRDNVTWNSYKILSLLEFMFILLRLKYIFLIHFNASGYSIYSKDICPIKFFICLKEYHNGLIECQ